MIASLLTCSCIVPAPVGDVTATGGPVLLINKGKTDPVLTGIVDWAPATNLALTFKVQGAIETSKVTQALRYTWYWDYDPKSGQPLVLFNQSCADSLCTVFLCEKATKNAVEHRLLVVVSDGTLRDDPTGPFDFPDGTAFDAVEWQIRRKGACP